MKVIKLSQPLNNSTVSRVIFGYHVLRFLIVYLKDCFTLAQPKTWLKIYQQKKEPGWIF